MKLVCNASPLIALAKAGYLDVLRALSERVVVPDGVVAEVMAGAADDDGVLALARLSWLEKVVLDPPMSGLSILHLGRGEAEVIEWACRHREFVALLDDRAARRSAEALGVRCAGTLRLLFEATRRGLLPSFADVVDRLKSVGLYCDQRAVDQIRQITSEVRLV